MNTLSRALLLAAVLAAVFSVGALSLHVWVKRQTQSLQAEAQARFAGRVDAALKLVPPLGSGADQDALDRLGAVLGAEVRIHPAGQIPPARPDHLQTVLPLDDGNRALVATSLAPAPARFQMLPQRQLAATLLLALVLGSIPVVIAVLGSRRPEADSRHPWHNARAEAAGLEQFARLTVERGAALEREHGARLRAEEDLHVSRSLLDRSLEERVRLGRELHDNVSQTLYAVTLTLESVRKNMTAAPAIEQRLDQCMTELRRLNQTIRTHLRDLEPAAVHSLPFGEALRQTLAAVTSPHELTVELKADPELGRLIPPAQAPEVLNLVREAASNSVRHGGARHLTVRAAADGDRLALVVADDGRGFDPEVSGEGHGLANMRARAANLGGTLQIESTPGKGTRVLLTLPATPCSRP